MKSREVSIKARSHPVSLSLKGRTTKHTTVKWSIALVPWVSPKSLKIVLVLTDAKLHSNPCDTILRKHQSHQKMLNWGNLLVYQAKTEHPLFKDVSLPAPVSVWFGFFAWILSSFLFLFFSSSLSQGTVFTT